MSAPVNNWVCFNGQFISEKRIFSHENRAFRYGDGLFETIRLADGHLHWIDDHFERLIAGMFTLGMDTTLFLPIEICNKILELARLNQWQNARIRLSVFREPGGAYKPDSDRYEYLISGSSLQDNTYHMNEKGWKIGLFTEIRKPANMLGSLKSANALLYVLAGRFARDNAFDEALILNEQGRICEGSTSNLFLVFPGGRLITPAGSEGILPGVMRKNLLRLMRSEGYQVEESQIMAEDLYKAEEIFLTNAIQGVRWVISYRERRYYCNTVRKISQLLLPR
jgi:branched-chain amino acid aminotransferase